MLGLVPCQKMRKVLARGILLFLLEKEGAMNIADIAFDALRLSPFFGRLGRRQKKEIIREYIKIYERSYPHGDSRKKTKKEN